MSDQRSGPGLRVTADPALTAALTRAARRLQSFYHSSLVGTKTTRGSAMEKPILQRCFELLDQLSVSNGAMTFVETALGDMVSILGKVPPWTPRELSVLRLIGE